MKTIRVDQSTTIVGLESFSAYLAEISRYPTLTREEERLLAIRIQEGDMDALNALIRANLRFVVSMARRYQNRGVSLGDLVGEGNLGLVVAAERFDGTRGVKFITYAVWWIRQALARVIGEQGHAVKVPPSQEALLKRSSRRAAALTQVLQREPSLHEILADMGLREEQSLSALAATRASLSLDTSTDYSDNTSLHSKIEDERSAVRDSGEGSEVNDSLKLALASLIGHERQVVSMYFGLDEAEPMTLEEIAGMLGITRERVRQIKLKALARLRKSPRLRALAS